MDMKTCTKCSVTQSVDCFNKRTRAKDGLEPWCKRCKRDWAAKHYAENREQDLARSHRWKTENREANRKYAREYGACLRTGKLEGFLTGRGKYQRAEYLDIRKEDFATIEEYRKAVDNTYLSKYRASDSHRNVVKTRRGIAKAFVYAIKQYPCLDCEQVFDPVCMEFDHTGTDKKFSIGKAMSQAMSLRLLTQEIMKCDLVCANCHRLRTKKRFWRSEEGRPA